MHRRLAAGLTLAAAALLTSCATPSASTPAAGAPDGPALGSVSPGLPGGDVVGQGTVLDTGNGAQLCLGPVAESYPPQCSGIPLEGWSWDDVDGSDSANGTTWGAYAVQGTYDGEVFTVTQPPIMLALYDPMMRDDPTGGKAGSATDADVDTIQQDLPDLLGDAYLGSYPDNGWVWVDVVWDDGTWQQAAEEDYGADAVVVRSALTEVD